MTRDSLTVATALILIMIAAMLVAVGLAAEGAENADPDPTPFLLTVSPTDSPYRQRAGALLSLPFGGGLDMLMSTPTSVEPAEAPASPEADTPPPAPYAATGSIEAAFLIGWEAGGGLALKDPAAAWRMALCESTGNLVTAGRFLGLLQFEPTTFGIAAAATGYWNAYDAFTQGFNGAWHSLYGTANPGGSGGWPSCWWA